MSKKRALLAFILFSSLALSFQNTYADSLAEYQKNGNHGSGNHGSNPNHGGGNPNHGGGNPNHGGGNPNHGNPNHGNPNHGGGNNGGNHGTNPNHGGNWNHGSNGGVHYSPPHAPSQNYGHGNVVNSGFNNHFQYAQNRRGSIYGHQTVGPWVTERAGLWHERYHGAIELRFGEHWRFHEYWHDHYWNYWARWGFYGGFYWEFHPYYEIHDYFWNPCIGWFYWDDWNDDYYHVWYGPEYLSRRQVQRQSEYANQRDGEYSYTGLHEAFAYSGVFFPTEEFRDLNVAVSGMDIPVQVEYRRGMTTVVERVRSEFGGVAPEKNDIVINHYQTLPEDTGIVAEGFVSHGSSQFPFKAFVSLSDSTQTHVFIPTTVDGEPTDAEIDQLHEINSQIENLGGVVETGSN